LSFRRLATWVGALLAIVGCTAAPVTPAPTPVAAGTPARASAAPAAAWDDLVSQARGEGSLILSGAPGELWRKALLAFQDAYPGIQVNFTGANSRDFWPKLRQERAAGQYLWDLRVGGPDPDVYQARTDGILASVRPLLVLPDVLDDSKWFGGYEALWADKERQYLPSFLAYARTTIFVNRDVHPAAQLHSPEQLLDPRYRGQMVLQDPRGGAGLGVLTVLLKGYGEGYVRELLSKQDVVISDDNRQLTEWVVRKRYPIGIGLPADQLLLFKQQGLIFNISGLDEGPKGLNIGFGAVQLLNNRPHPAAAQVFVNWLLSQEGQTRIVTVLQDESRRLDVPSPKPDEKPQASQMSAYIAHQTEELLPIRTQALQLARELIK
jgi:ABC-type Fe3+ transport system substrate-binding protein